MVPRAWLYPHRRIGVPVNPGGAGAHQALSDAFGACLVPLAVGYKKNPRLFKNFSSPSASWGYALGPAARQEGCWGGKDLPRVHHGNSGWKIHHRELNDRPQAGLEAGAGTDMAFDLHLWWPHARPDAEPMWGQRCPARCRLLLLLPVPASPAQAMHDLCSWRRLLLPLPSPSDHGGSISPADIRTCWRGIMVRLGVFFADAAGGMGCNGSV